MGVHLRLGESQSDNITFELQTVPRGQEAGRRGALGRVPHLIRKPSQLSSQATLGLLAQC